MPQEVLALYEESTDEVFGAVMAIAVPSETLIRVIDYALVHTGDLVDALGIVAPYWVKTQDHLEEEAGRYRIPVANVMERFCGPDCLQDPVAAGLIAADQEHPTDEGAEIITRMIPRTLRRRRAMRGHRLECVGSVPRGR